MIIRFRTVTFLASLIALVASREHAAAKDPVDRVGAPTAVLSADGSIIRMAQDDQSTSSTQTPDSTAVGDDQSGPPTESPQ